MAQERWRVCQNKQIRPDLDCRADRPKFDDGERASPAAEGETNEHEIEPRSPVVPYPLAKRKGNRRPSRIWATGKMFRPAMLISRMAKSNCALCASCSAASIPPASATTPWPSSPTISAIIIRIRASSSTKNTSFEAAAFHGLLLNSY